MTRHTIEDSANLCLLLLPALPVRYASLNVEVLNILLEKELK
jgi:hypothetical protein